MRARLGWLPLGAAAGLLALGLWAPPGATAATLTVDTTDEFSATNCSLNEAITSANIDDDFGPGCVATDLPYGDDTINITATGTINLTGTVTPLLSHIDIIGPGADQLDIHRQLGPAFRILQVNNTAEASISGVTVSNGRVSGVGATGAGIINFGELALEDVVVRDNVVAVTSSDVNPAPGGGGIANGGSLSVRQSTIEGNTVATLQDAPSGATLADAAGGGIQSTGDLEIARSTFTNNTATAEVTSADPSASAFATGGAIQTLGGNASLHLTTVSGNQSVATAPPTANETTRGGGISNLAGTLTLSHSTIASNSATSSTNVSAQGTETVSATIIGGPGPNCDGSINTNSGFNLEFPASCPGLESALHTDPQLLPLDDYGGPTLTMALGQTSAALDQGPLSGDPSDQRGALRTFDLPGIANAAGGAGADIGALEAQDTDGDGIVDEADECPAVSGGANPGGCPLVERELTLRYSKRQERFKGKLIAAANPDCAGPGFAVSIWRKEPDDDKEIGDPVTDGDGKYSLEKRAKKGKRYYATVNPELLGETALCDGARSPTLKIR